jgi:hypothetical protein
MERVRESGTASHTLGQATAARCSTARILSSPVTLADIVSQRSEVARLTNSLEPAHGKPVYFPFARYGTTQLRPAQGYMLKMPSALVALLRLPIVPSRPVTQEALGAPRGIATILSKDGPRHGGGRYEPANELLAVSKAKPIERGPRTRRTGSAVASTATKPDRARAGVRGARCAVAAFRGPGLGPRVATWPDTLHL